MTGHLWLLVDIIGGLVIVAFAVGVPYLITHRGMRSPYDRANRAEAEVYFRRKRAFFRRLRRLQRQKETASAQPERVGRK
jgi:hypothetical protein